MKNFVKALDVKGPAFTLCGKLLFIGPQIRQLYEDQQFEAVLSDKEKTAWQSFEKVSNCVHAKKQNFRLIICLLILPSFIS